MFVMEGIAFGFDYTEAIRREQEKERHKAHRECRMKRLRIKPADQTEPTAIYDRGWEMLQWRELFAEIDPIDDTPLLSFEPPAPDECELGNALITA